MIYIIITTSIHNKNGIINFTHRKNRYLQCITSLLNLIKNMKDIRPIIVENNGQDNTYLNDLSCDILYTNNNNSVFGHKGGNELADIKEVINHYHINDDDTIIKLTGRYKILNLDFINLVQNNCETTDAFVKFFNVATKKFHPNMDDCVLGLFAIKCKYLRNFDYQYVKSPESEFAFYVKEFVPNIMKIEKLNLECCFANNFSKLNV